MAILEQKKLLFVTNLPITIISFVILIKSFLFAEYRQEKILEDLGFITPIPKDKRFPDFLKIYTH